MRGLDNIIKNQDQDIERRERQLVSKEEQIKRRFSALEGQVNNMQAQGQYLKARFGNQESGSQGGG